MTLLSPLKIEQTHEMPVDLEFSLIIVSLVAEILKSSRLPELHLAMTTKSTLIFASHAATINGKIL